MKYKFLIFLFAIIVNISCAQHTPVPENYSNFRKAPYLLYPADNSEMLIMWQTDSTRNCLLEWGLDTTYAEGSLQSTEFDDHQHKILLTGLSPATKYFYKVSSGSENVKSGSFYTGALDTEKKISFYAYGDTRTNPDIHDQLMEQMMSHMEQHPDMQTFIISSGDLVSDGNKESDWDKQYFDPDFSNIQQMLASLPAVNAVGNHEGQGILFKKYFPFPMFASERYYYSFDYGPAHFTVVDQFTDYDVGSPQYEWMVNDLASTDKSWKFILLHEPGWSAGGHSNNLEVQTIIQPLCRDYGVQFVITGHNHFYARAVVDGIFHITTGGGGAPLYTPDLNHPGIVKISKTNHFCSIEIDGDSLAFTAINMDGSIIETFHTGLLPDAVVENTEDWNDDFKVYSSGHFIKVILKKEYQASFSIYDNWGRKIYEGKLDTGENMARADVPGIYFVRIDFGGNRLVKKVFVN